MKPKKTIIIPIVLLIAVIPQCSKQTDPGDPASVVKAIVSAENLRTRLSLFSEKSVMLISQAELRGEIPGGAGSATLPFLSGKIKWIENGRSRDGDSCEIKIIITSHESENLIGTPFSIKFVREGGLWKIDISDEMSAMFKKKRGINASDYIRRLKNQ